jgi:hypothetical protein
MACPRRMMQVERKAVPHSKTEKTYLRCSWGLGGEYKLHVTLDVTRTFMMV